MFATLCSSPLKSVGDPLLPLNETIAFFCRRKYELWSREWKDLFRKREKLFLTSIKTSCSHLTFSTEVLSSPVCVRVLIWAKSIHLNLKKKSPLVKLYGFYLQGQEVRNFRWCYEPYKGCIALESSWWTLSEPSFSSVIKPTSSVLEHC